MRYKWLLITVVSVVVLIGAGYVNVPAITIVLRMLAGITLGIISAKADMYDGRHWR